MRLSKFSDYAVRVCLYLAAHPDRTVPISEITEAHGLSQNNLMKVVQQLVEGRILQSVRGRSGGVRLAQPPEELGMGSIIRLMETRSAMVDCDSCILDGICGAVPPLVEAERAFFGTLDRYSLADALQGDLRGLARLQGAAPSRESDRVAR